MNIYITIKGNKQIDLTNRVVEWNDCHGHHKGVVVKYGRTSDQSGSPVTCQKFVFAVDCGDDGLRELRPHELRDIIEGENMSFEAGWLYHCDKQGNNCEPLNADDEPYALEDADTCDMGEGSTIRRACIDDDCDARVTHVAVDANGEVVGYFRFRMVEEISE